MDHVKRLCATDYDEHELDNAVVPFRYPVLVQGKGFQGMDEG